MPAFDFKDVETVFLDDEKHALVIINQTKLPGELELLALRELDEIWNAIYYLQVQGASIIGISAAIGAYLAAKRIEAKTFDLFLSQFRKVKAYLASARPTAINLFRALDRMERVVLQNERKPIGKIVELLRAEAMAIREEDIAVCRAMGENGLLLIRNKIGILTHGSAGRLSAIRYGTALAPIYVGLERGYMFKVFVNETRPLLQGARLTAYELLQSGVETTVICDSMAAHVMKNGWVQAVFVGCDRVAANGDVCSKIGTSGLAIMAKHYNIPFYVCASTSSVDMSMLRGEDIPIEQRPEQEVTDMWYEKRTIPGGAAVINPAFDITENSLISAFVTERGIIKAPYARGMRELTRKDEAE